MSKRQDASAAEAAGVDRQSTSGGAKPHRNKPGTKCRRESGYPAGRLQRATLGTFLQGHLDELAATAPAESRHALNPGELQAPKVALWVAHDGEVIVGTGALAALEPGHEELKSMRTDPQRRGQGAATQLLEHLLHDARFRRIRRISLETGSMEFFTPARALYAKAGFLLCSPFGPYLEDPHSVFMTKHL